MGFDILESILCVFLIALVVTVIFRQLRLSVILGYLIVGAVVGPNALKLIPDSSSIKELAEFGIVFLMFTVGLEFSLPKLFSLRYSVFFVGGLQVLISIILTTIVGMTIGMSTISAIIVGGVVAMSSTAIVIKQLNDQRELHSTHGLNAVGILLFQDLAVIPFIILISGLANDNNESIINIILWALLKGVIAIFIIYFVGTWLLRPLFRIISKTRAIELFTLTVLLVTLTSAWLTHVLGLSFALGAFLAGMMLSETEFRHQIEVEIRPFRDILLGLFFITIGMLTDVSSWFQTWKWIGLLLLAIIIGKMLLITLLCRIRGNSFPVAFRTGLILAQGGEFGFAILTLALTQNIISVEYGQVILAALLISIAISPLLIYFNEKIATFFILKEINQHQQVIQPSPSASKLTHHIILCGYGRVGQHIARMLDKINTAYIGLDIDHELIERASLAGDHVILGDSTHPAILRKAGLEHAKVLVISLEDFAASKKILSIVRQIRPTIPILVRCRDEIELTKLKKSGPTYVIAEIFEESLTMLNYLMQIIKIPQTKISELMQEVRSKDYDILQKVFSGSYSEDEEIRLHRELRPILISSKAFALNHKLSDFNFENIHIEVIGIRRGNEKQIKPRGNMRLHVNDIIILFGEVQDLEEAERILIEGW